MTRPEPSKPTIDTSIHPQRLYRSDDICHRMGWRASGWRAARRAGLRALRVGKRFFVRGSDLIEFAESASAKSEDLQ